MPVLLANIAGSRQPRPPAVGTVKSTWSLTLKFKFSSIQLAIKTLQTSKCQVCCVLDCTPIGLNKKRFYAYITITREIQIFTSSRIVSKQFFLKRYWYTFQTWKFTISINMTVIIIHPTLARVLSPMLSRNLFRELQLNILKLTLKPSSSKTLSSRITFNT